MIATELINVRNASGKVIPLELLSPKTVTYLDYGYLSQKLPRDFSGYRIKNTNIVAEKQGDGSFIIPDNSTPFRPV